MRAFFMIAALASASTPAFAQTTVKTVPQGRQHD